MQIHNGPLSSLLTYQQSNRLSSYYTELHPSIDAEISINDNEKDAQGNSVRTLRYVMQYAHPLQPQEEVFLQVEHPWEEGGIERGIDDCVQQYLKQTESCEHDFVRHQDRFGNPYPDGRAICVHCQLTLKKHLPEIPGVSMISSTFGGDVVARHDWGSARLQGGGIGVVFTLDGAYETAFVEAFPTIHGFSTFLRGEGCDMAAAEDACWASYRRMLNCDGHEWDRTVRGVLRTDGYATCKHCGLSAQALSPTTLCHVCQTPSSKKWGEQWICLTHYFATPEPERVHMRLQVQKKMGRQDDIEKVAFDYRFRTRIYARAFTQLGSDLYQKHLSTLEQLVAYIKHNFYILMLESHPLMSGATYDALAEEKMNQCHTHLFNHFNEFLAYACYDPSSTEAPPKFTFKSAIPPHYWPAPKNT